MKTLRPHFLIVIASVFAASQIGVQPSVVRAETFVNIVGKPANPATLARYKNPELSFEFNYPRAMVPTSDPDPNAVVKLSGPLNGRGAELKVSKLPGAQDLQLAERSIEGLLRDSFPGSRLSGRRAIKFGKSLQLSGTESLFSVRVGGELYATRMVVFADSKQTYFLTFFTLADGDSMLKPIFEQVLASIEQQSAGASVHNQVRHQSWTFEKFSDAEEKVSFDVPSGWKVERGAPGSHEIRFHGTDLSNNAGELFFVSLDRTPGASLETYKSAAQAGWKACKDYKLVASTHSTFGVGRYDGDIDLYTFSVSNVPFHQLSANFFDEKRFHIIGINGALWNEHDIRSALDRVLATLKISE